MTDINTLVHEELELNPKPLQQFPLKGKSGDETKDFKQQFEKSKANVKPKNKDDSGTDAEGNVIEKDSTNSGESASTKLQKHLQKTSKK